MRAAVVGAGHISRQHLACLSELSSVHIAAVCDISPAVAEAAAERFRVGAWYTDHRAMLREIKPDVVHVTTPPASHFVLAQDALENGAHVIVEKPVTLRYDEAAALLQCATAKSLVLIEDYNYVFNSQVQQLLELIESGGFGAVVHVDVVLGLNILNVGSPFVDLNAPHPFLALEGGAISDFLPHLASLAHAFVGEHRSVRTVWSKRAHDHPLPSDEFRALVEADLGTATLGFSAHAQPDTFNLRVEGTKMRAAANLFEPRLTMDRVRGCPRPLIPLLNGLQESRQVRQAAYGGLWRKLSGGPGAYEGLWELLRRTYSALEQRAAPPVSIAQIRAVNRLVGDLKNEDYRL